jgi:uncharacterized membrane protein YccC
MHTCTHCQSNKASSPFTGALVAIVFFTMLPAPVLVALGAGVGGVTGALVGVIACLIFYAAVLSGTWEKRATLRCDICGRDFPRG